MISRQSPLTDLAFLLSSFRSVENEITVISYQLIVFYSLTLRSLRPIWMSAWVTCCAEPVQGVGLLRSLPTPMVL